MYILLSRRCLFIITIGTVVPSLLSQVFRNCCHKCTIATGTIVTIEVVRLWQQLWYDCDNRHLSCSSNRLTSFFIICISRWLYLSLFTLKVDYYIWTRIWMIIAEITLKIAFLWHIIKEIAPVLIYLSLYKYL